MTIGNATAIAKSSPLDGPFLRSKDEPKTRPNIAKEKKEKLKLVQTLQKKIKAARSKLIYI
jgi:hypothetical protein